MRYAVVSIEKLLPHEETSDEGLKEISSRIRERGTIGYPIAVAEVDGMYVIIDGHHRWRTLQEMGCTKVPVYVLDYLSDEVVLDFWREDFRGKVGKNDVLYAARSRRKFPHKTTHHRFRDYPNGLPPREVSLSELYSEALEVVPA